MKRAIFAQYSGSEDRRGTRFRVFEADAAGVSQQGRSAFAPRPRSARGQLSVDEDFHSFSCVYMPITVLDIPANRFIEQFAKNMKKQANITQPAWSVYVKTGSAKQYGPEDPDWYYMRAAAILRRLYTQGTAGITDICHYFCSAKDGTVVPRHFRNASSGVISSILKQLEKQGLIEKEEGKGRKLTDKGRKTLDQFASQLK